MNESLVVALIELILTRGPAIAVTLIQGLNTNNPTPEQIRELKVKDPKSYFKELEDERDTSGYS